MSRGEGGGRGVLCRLRMSEVETDQGSGLAVPPSGRYTLSSLKRNKCGSCAYSSTFIY